MVALRRQENVRKQQQRVINLMDVVRRLIENCCGFIQTGIQRDLLRSNEKAVHLKNTLARTTRRILIASGSRPILDAVHTEEYVEDDGEDEDAEKDVYESGNYSDERMQGVNKVIENRAEHDGRDKGRTLTCHMPARSSRKNMRQMMVRLAMWMAIINRVTAMMSAKVMDPNTISPKVTGLKEIYPKAMSSNMWFVDKTRMKSWIKFLCLGTNTTD